MTALDRPVPTVTPDSEPYWRSENANALRLQQGESYAAFRFYPTPVCPSCGTLGGSWEPISGAGTLYSYTVVHRPASPAFEVEDVTDSITLPVLAGVRS